MLQAGFGNPGGWLPPRGNTPLEAWFMCLPIPCGDAVFRMVLKVPLWLRWLIPKRTQETTALPRRAQEGCGVYMADTCTECAGSAARCIIKPSFPSPERPFFCCKAFSAYPPCPSLPRLCSSCKTVEPLKLRASNKDLQQLASPLKRTVVRTTNAQMLKRSLIYGVPDVMKQYSR